MTPEELWELIKTADDAVISEDIRDNLLSYPREQIVSLLCQLSLKRKWVKGMGNGINELCPFCLFLCVIKDIEWSEVDECTECICPPEICNRRAKEGLISNLSSTLIDDLNDDELEEIRTAFQKHI